ncbi:hypothetical protein E4U37_000720 [Claviceps purpurea]|nr:hypothetical protein E4U37_000720 [Claviceps purpurea]
MESKFDDAKLLSYTESEFLPDFSNVVSLSPKYLAKGYENGDMVEDALSAMKFASQLGIQVPHIERVIHGDGVCCIMERIPRTTLDIAWHDLGWIASLRLAFQQVVDSEGQLRIIDWDEAGFYPESSE